MLNEIAFERFLSLFYKKGYNMSELHKNIPFFLQMINSDIESYLIKKLATNQDISYFDEISTAYKHPLNAGGKRVRPLLTLICAGAFSGETGIETARNSALAVEKIHTYSLVHDDLPCMDNDDLRRGLPTTHKIYGEAKGLLIGDALLTESFKIIAQTSLNRPKYLSFLINELSEGSGVRGMILGQWLDISYTNRNEVTWEQMEIVHRNKTGKLLGTALSLGFLCGADHFKNEIPETKLFKLNNIIKEAGELIGLSFQIIDDILDATKSSEQLGKTSGKDEAQNKLTAVKLLGFDKAEKLAASYTDRAKLLLQSLFENTHIINNNINSIYYQKMLLSQIELLLDRSK